MKQLTFVTGNANKRKEVNAILKMDLISVKLDLPELQGEPAEIAKQKCRLAFEQVKGPVMVEDTSLCFHAMKGLPGPYIKWFLDKLGLDGLNKMLFGFDDKSGYAQCIFALKMNKDDDPKVFVGQTMGKIVPPRGLTTFGWDPIFLPDGQDLTYAEMKVEDKNKISHRYRALDKLKLYLEQNEMHL